MLRERLINTLLVVWLVNSLLLSLIAAWVLTRFVAGLW
ncbi:MAG: hypothetical protein DDT34_02149 [Firmicutes bacterium]|nr:hypothetical protein [Bacillota bacterium]